jgi:hypothetical protein
MNTINASKMSLAERRKLLDSSKGTFFSCSFVKKDGSVRNITCKKFIRSYLTDPSSPQANPAAHKENLYTVAEMAVEGFRNISLDKLIEAKVNSNIYKFVEE